MNRRYAVAANGIVTQDILGEYSHLYIRVANVPVEISFNGNDWQGADLNDVFGPLEPKPTRVYFRAVGGLAANISIDYDTKPITAQSVSQKVAETEAHGSRHSNLTQVPANAVPIPNGYLNRRRKSLVLTVVNGGSAGVNDYVTILDADGDYFGVVFQGVPFLIETDAEFSAFASDSGMALYCGEVYYL